ncbi:sugar kinase [Streptomyces hilarionis]|uniref:sugar kinase n=1 Tax=Streptomyces hilarionis TaxID=2839954 RepID=UPI00211A96B4|nr:sugar kinase [Streptomyces hilarionis]MCQ9136337.1 sugar kinase [Streptomyces hilarionis]
MTGTGFGNAPDVVDVVALGESMVALRPTGPGRLADAPSFDRGIGGAESNVVCALAAAGHPARWVSRVGADGFGDHLVETVGSYGVDVSRVRRDPDRPTGVYFRTAADRAGDDHEVAYYRAGSAASAMSADTVDLDAVTACRVLHLTGITAALSATCLGLLRELTARRPGRPLVSFDVNHRPRLWKDGNSPRVLLELARGADLVFVGEDEAADVWGLDGVDAVRRALPGPEVLVVKQGARGATLLDRERVLHVPAPRVDVVAAVGAGDAFAAGFLSATLRGLPPRDRLRHGHLAAAAALTVPGDLATPPSRHHADRLAALDDNAWGRLRLGPGRTQAPAAPEEAPTP